MTREDTNKLYDEILRKARAAGNTNATLRHLCKNDLFFLLTRICKRDDIDRDWLYDVIREVEAAPDGYIDLWAREHYKSTIITFGMTVQNILNAPDITVGIFSYKVGAAKGFLKQIRRELEDNKLLIKLFPDILYPNPAHQSPQWNEDGIIVKRRTNPKECTVEAHGVIESQPTGRHFQLLVYDDVVDERFVSTPDQIAKTTKMWELSTNLGSDGGRVRYIGTRYHYDDTYRTIMDRGIAIPRIKPGTDDGTPDGKPVFFSQEYMDLKRRAQSPYVFSCQILQDPQADSIIGFREDWLKYWHPENLGKMNRYIFVDPASGKKKTNDFTCMMVVGMSADDNYYIIDMVRDRLDLDQKAKMLMFLHRRYKPTMVYYEEYGLMADIEHCQWRMAKEQYRFKITKVAGKLNKLDRIQKLIPLFKQERVYIPAEMNKLDYQGVSQDLTNVFVNQEYLNFPFAQHDDMLDALSRICDDAVHMHPPMKNENVKVYSAGETEYNWENI